MPSSDFVANVNNKSVFSMLKGKRSCGMVYQIIGLLRGLHVFHSRNAMIRVS